MLKNYVAFIDLEKTYVRVDREALWNVLIMYVEGLLLEGIKLYYKEASTCIMGGWRAK